jgi:hypothetical protein
MHCSRKLTSKHDSNDVDSTGHDSGWRGQADNRKTRKGGEGPERYSAQSYRRSHVAELLLHQALTLLNCYCIKLALVVAVYFCLESIYVVRMLLRKINFDSDK